MADDLCLTVSYSQKAAAYKTEFAEVTKRLAKETGDRRHWISSKWTDTDAGKGQEIKLLEYACGPGTVSLVRTTGIGCPDEMLTDIDAGALCDEGCRP